MSTTGKEYKLAIRIAGIIDKSFNASLVSTKSSLAAFKTSVNALDKDFTKLDKGFDGAMKAGKKCFDAVATAATVSAAAVGAAAAASTYYGSQFESAFAGVKKTVDATDAEYAKLRKDILAMTRDIPSSGAKIAGVEEIAGQLGIATESLTNFTRTMINLGVSTNMTADEAATDLAKFANIVQMADYGADGISNWERLGSTIVDLGNNFATTEADIVSMSTRLASTGDLVGLSEAQILALATAMSSVGIKAESGGSTMSKLLKKMQLAVETNSGALEDYAAVANMTGKQFSETFKKDAVVALSAFIGGLKDTERNGKSAIAILDDMGLSEIRLSNTILALANSGDLMTNAIDTANQAWDENTALAIEAGKRYETAESKVQLMKNAFVELGITAYEDLREPFVFTVSEITDKVHKMNDSFYDSDGIGGWVGDLNIKLPTFRREAKNAWKIAKPFFDGVMGFGKWCLKNPDTIIGVLSGMASTMIAFKAASTTVHTINALTNFIAMCASNPVTGGIMATVGAIGMISMITTAADASLSKLANRNLAEHFGSIALSMEDIQSIAEYIVSSDSLGGVRKALEAFDDLDGFSSAMKNALAEINKMDWKVAIGMELTPDEQESYKQSIDDYVKAAQDYALQAQYAVSLNLKASLDGADSGTLAVADKVNQFYQDNYTEMVDLGGQLSKAVNDAFADGVLDPDEINNMADIQGKMAKLQERIAVGEFDAQMSAIGLKYNGSELTADSFRDLQDALGEQVDKLSDVYLNSYTKNLAAAEAALASNDITQSEYDKLKTALDNDYLSKMNNLIAKSAEFQFSTIGEQYSPDILQSARGSMDLDYLKNQQLYTQEQLKSMDYDPLQDYFFQAFQDLRNDQNFEVVRAAVEKLLDAAMPTVEQMESVKARCEATGQEIPESIVKGLEQYQFYLGIADGDMDTFYRAIGESMVGTEYVDVIRELQEQGRDIPQALIDGINEGLSASDAIGAANNAMSSIGDGAAAGTAAETAKAVSDATETTVKPAVDDMYNATQSYINQTLSKGFSGDADVSVKLTPKFDWSRFDTTPKVPNGDHLLSTLKNAKIHQNATGGIWDHPILTTFAEKGPEAAIPLDGSRNAINLWQKAGRLLGMDSVYADLESFANGGSGVSSFSDKASRLAGMDSVLDDLSMNSSAGPTIQWSPVLNFYGEAPSKKDITDALSISQDEFDRHMDQYLKTRGRVSFA